MSVAGRGGGGVCVIVGATISVGAAVGVSACDVSKAACPVRATAVEIYPSGTGVGDAPVPGSTQPARIPESEANRTIFFSI